MKKFPWRVLINQTIMDPEIAFIKNMETIVALAETEIR